MGALNKERIAFLAALVVGLYCLAGAFSGEGDSGELPSIPPADGSQAVPPMNIVKVEFLDSTFDYYWGSEDMDVVRNPWTPPKKTSKPTGRDFAMPEPELRPVATVVPASPFAPRQSLRPVIRQLEPPVSVEREEPEDGAEENGNE